MVREAVLKALLRKNLPYFVRLSSGQTSSELIGQLSTRRGIIVSSAVQTGVRPAGKFLALSVFALIMSSNASAADLRLPIDPTVARPATTPLPKSRKELFEEYLQWKKQQSR
jgi:hypothetical protein